MYIFLLFVLATINWTTNNYTIKVFQFRVLKFLKISPIALKHAVIRFCLNDNNSFEN